MYRCAIVQEGALMQAHKRNKLYQYNSAILQQYKITIVQALKEKTTVVQKTKCKRIQEYTNRSIQKRLATAGSHFKV